MPSAIESLDLRNYDLILSSSHCVAKGVKKRPQAVHVSYIHAPMRYMWDRFEDYFSQEKSSWWVRKCAQAIRGPLQAWDRRVSQKDRVDLLISNSHFIAQQVQNAYGRSSEVVHPFVDSARFLNIKRKSPEAYLIVGAFAPNKRLEIAVEACKQLNLPLWVLGSGQEEKKLKAMAGPQTRFFDSPQNSEIDYAFSVGKALLFPGVEDFGIVPLEAMASGVPIIAYSAGGILDSTTPETALYFKEQSVESLVQAILHFERNPTLFDEKKLRLRAQEFSREKFLEKIRNLISKTL